MDARARPKATPHLAREPSADAGPRFDLRFDAGRGLLRLARPLPAGPARIEALELVLAAVRFPMDVTEGAARFRTRRTVVRTGLVAIDPRDLSRAAERAGVGVSIAGSLPRGAVAVAVSDEVGAIAFDATVVAEGSDLLIAAERVRVAVDGPATPWARLDRVATKLGLRFDAERGAWRVERPVRALLAEALVTRGWRLPDERAAELGPPRLADGRFVLPIGARPMDDQKNGRGPELLEEARLLAPVVACLVGSDVAAAADRLDALRSRLAERPGAEPELLEAVTRLGCAVAIERSGAELDAARATEGSDDASLLCVGLRAALRLRDHALAEAVAERLAAVDPVPELAAEALVAAGELLREATPERARRLLRRALARRPGDTALLLRCIDLAELAGEAEHIEELARRALSSPLSPADRARVASAAARALERSSEERDEEAGGRGDSGVGGGIAKRAERRKAGGPRSSSIEELWREALHASPEDPDALAGLGARRARHGDRDAAVARFDRAAQKYVERAAAARYATGAADRAAAARTLSRAAELLAGGGKLAAAEERLERAVAYDDTDAALWCSLARVRLRLGATDAAGAAYASLLGLGARGTATLPPALVEAACFHIEERDDMESAEPFVDLLARRSQGDARVAVLRERLVRARREASGDAASDIGRARSELGGSPGDVAPPPDLDSLLDAIEAEREPGDARDSAIRGALSAARAGSDPAALGLLAERLAELDRLPGDVALLDQLERHAIDPRPRAEIARAAARILRAEGRLGPAALALARAGAILRDAATLRAAMDLAEGAGAWAEAFEAVSVALEVVGDGPARASLLARRERIEKQR